MSEQSKRPTDFFLLYQAPLLQHLKAAAALLLILFLFRFNAILALGTHFLGGVSRDSGLYVWLSTINTQDLFSSEWFQTKAFYPYGLSLAWSDNFIFPALFTAALSKIGFNFESAYNLTLLGAGFLNGYLTYRLCFGLWGTFLPALIAGAAFQSTAFFSGNLGHPQLEFAFWIPFALYYLFLYLSKPTILASLALGLVISSCFLTTVYYSLFIIVSVVSVLAGVWLLKPKSYSLKEVLFFILGIALGAAPILFFLNPYLEVRTAFGERGIYEAHYFSATALSYLAQSDFGLLYAWTSRFSHNEAFLGTGIVFLVCSLFGLKRLGDAKPLRNFLLAWGGIFLAVCFFSLELLHGISFLPVQLPNLFCALFSWVNLILFLYILYRLGKLERSLNVHILTNRDLLAICFLGALLFFLISLGPQGNPEKDHWALGVFRLIYETVPGFNSVRAIGRSGIVCTLFLSIALAGALTFLQKQGKSKYLLMGLGAFILLENFPRTYPLEAKQAPLNLPIPESHEQTTIVLPMTRELDKNDQVKSWGDFAELNIDAMLAGLTFPGNIVNGYSGQRTKLMKELPGEVAAFPDLRSFNALHRICGLTYIIYRSSKDPKFQMHSFTRKIDGAAELFRYVAGDSDGNYLFEKAGTLKLSDQKAELLVPPLPRQTVNIELMHSYAKKAPTAEVFLHLEDHLPGVPLAQFRLAPDGNWQNFSVPLPETGEKVRPLRLTFHVEPRGAQVLFRGSKCQSEEKKDGESTAR